MKIKRIENTNHFFKSKFERRCFYVTAILFAGMVFGLVFVSGVHFFRIVNNIFIYYIPSVCAVFVIAAGVTGLIRLNSNADALKRFLSVPGRLRYSSKLWPLYLIFSTLFVAAVFGPIISFVLWNNAKILSTVFSYQPYEEIVELQSIGVNNRRRKNILKVVFHSEKIPDPIRVDIKRGNMKVNEYRNIVDDTQVNKMVCIKGYQAPWGLVINQVIGPKDCK
ncbi:MAG: hypothetical protein V4732_20070 [Pseudomonadota bacterium]